MNFGFSKLKGARSQLVVVLVSECYRKTRISAIAKSNAQPQQNICFFSQVWIRLYCLCIDYSWQTFGLKKIPLKQNEYNCTRRHIPHEAALFRVYVRIFMLFDVNASEGTSWTNSVFDRIRGCRQAKVSAFFGMIDWTVSTGFSWSLSCHELWRLRPQNIETWVANRRQLLIRHHQFWQRHGYFVANMRCKEKNKVFGSLPCFRRPKQRTLSLLVTGSVASI